MLSRSLAAGPARVRARPVRATYLTSASG